MSDHNRTGTPERLTLFVCSDCEACDRATVFLQGWANGRPEVALEIVSILEQPEQAIRLRITHTPALVVGGELLAQNISVDTLSELLRTRPE